MAGPLHRVGKQFARRGKWLIMSAYARCFFARMRWPAVCRAAFPERQGGSGRGLLFLFHSVQPLVRHTPCTGQKESVCAFPVIKRMEMSVFADGHFFPSAPNRVDFLKTVHVCLLILTAFPQKCGRLSARMRTALRKKHFFCAQRAVRLCARFRIFVRKATECRPQGGKTVTATRAFAELFTVSGSTLRQKSSSAGLSERKPYAPMADARCLLVRTALPACMHPSGKNRFPLTD